MNKMNLDYDINEKVSNLESLGRRICSDLRNLQRERIILSREAKCLLSELEREETQRDHSKINKNDDNEPCSCAIWENDIGKEDKNEIEGLTTLITQKNEESNKNICKECCQHCVSRNDDNTIYKCLTYRYDKFDEPFHCDRTMKNIDYPCIGDNVTIKDDPDDDNNADDLNKYCETCTINPSYFYDLCVFCENDEKVDVNGSKESGIEESIERERGGGGNSDLLSSPSICNCECDLCALRNKYGERPPCYKNGDRIDRSIDIDDEDDLSFDQATCSELPEISQYCRIDKLREALERLKNRNHTLRKLLKSQECLLNNAKCKHCSRLLERYDDIDLVKDSEDSRDNGKKITNDLVATIKILQSKCRIKDGMIVALADELTGSNKSDRIRRILRRLADVNPDCQTIDFDRSTLWKYLECKERTRSEEDSVKSDKSAHAN